MIIEILNKLNWQIWYHVFAMSSNILKFRGKYYKYDGAVPINEGGLAIGGFEFAWLVDLTMAFLHEKKHGKREFWWHNLQRDL